MKIRLCEGTAVLINYVTSRDCLQIAPRFYATGVFYYFFS